MSETLINNSISTNNYIHVCSIWVCKKCGHQDWDNNFKTERKEKIISQNEVKITEITRCPKCNSKEIDGEYTSRSSTLTWSNSNNYVTNTYNIKY